MKIIYRREPGDGTKPRLSRGHIYHVVGLSDQSFRVLNDSKEPILYPRECFDIVDGAVPSDWIRKDFEDGEFYIDPEPCAEPGFYEDYFDGDERALRVFNEVVQEVLS